MSKLLFDRIVKNPSKISIIAITGLFVLASVPVNATTTKIGTAMTFDFKGCTKSSDGQDIICVGSFRNRDADRKITVGRTSTFITDFEGKNHVSDEIKVSDRSCRRNCNSLSTTLAEGVEYKTIFVFKDVSLPSPKIALLQIVYGFGGSVYRSMKFRRIPVSSKLSEDRSERINSNLTNQQELQNAAIGVERQDHERAAIAQSEQQKKDREAARRRLRKFPKKKKLSWADQQLNQGILDLIGKPRKPGKK